ncbi:MAG: HalD/BesD family halogenase [Janthinobacterium lividum]
MRSATLPENVSPPPVASHPASAPASGAAALPARLAELDGAALQDTFHAQGEFLFLKDFLPEATTRMLIDGMQAARVEMNRNYLPGHKKGGSVSRHAIDRLAPGIAELYRSPALIAWLSRLSRQKLQVSPETDPHAYALYFYTEPGDHIGWHYDTSYYKGRRYTLLLGVVDRSSSKLEYRLHTRDASKQTVAGIEGLDPGGLVFFDGDQLHHRITPLGVGEERVSLTFEYVTDPDMGRWQRFISNMKDAVAYFGFRQVFRSRRAG